MLGWCYTSGRMRWLPVRMWVGAVGSGVLQVLCFPIAGPMPVWRSHVCWVALVPLLYVLVAEGDSRRVRDGFALGYGCGVVWYGGTCYWIFATMHQYGGLSEPVSAGILVLFCLYLGLYHAVFGGVVAALRGSRLGRQGTLLLVPVVWVGVELLRARVTGFPWDLLGVAQVDNPVLRRLAPWTGVYGMSFVIAGVNALWLLRLEVRDRRWVRPALAVVGTAVVAGYAVLALRGVGRRVETGPVAEATLVQENLLVGEEAAGQRPESETGLLRQFARLSRQPSAELLTRVPGMAGTRVVERPRRLLVDPSAATAAGGMSGLMEGAYERSGLVVWPESPAPFREEEPEFRAAMSGLARGMHAPVVVGNIGTVEAGGRVELRNSASFVLPDGAFAGRYDKVHLVPFGEYVPFKRLFFFAGSLLAEVGQMEPGTQRRVFALPDGHKVGVFICYESIFGDEVREFARMGAGVLVNISDDGWYGDTSAPWQHLNMVRMRAVENHRWVLRATNTGVTAAIDPEGRVVAGAPRHIRTAVRVPFRWEGDETFYVRHGDWFAWGCLLGTVGAVGWLTARQRS